MYLLCSMMGYSVINSSGEPVTVAICSLYALMASMSIAVKIRIIMQYVLTVENKDDWKSTANDTSTLYRLASFYSMQL